MNIKSFLKHRLAQPYYLTCIALFALLAGCANNTDTAENVAQATPPPNILLILSDDHAWNDYSFMGHNIVRTPSLDKLANEGVTFKRGYVPTSLCRPSLATIATGLYASQHGITGNNPSNKLKGGKKGELYKNSALKLLAKLTK